MRHGVRFGRRRDFHGLEAALERTVLFDGLAVLGRRRRADALDFAARQRRLQDVGGVERAFGRTRAHQGVQLIDEDDGVLVLHQLLHDGLQALFELSAVLGAGDDQREVERQNPLVGQETTARRHRRSAAPGPRRWRSCRHRARRSAPDCSSCGGTGSGRRARVRSRGRSAGRATVHRRLGQVAAELAQQRAFLRAVGGHLLRGGPGDLFPHWESRRPRSCRISAAKDFSSRSSPSSRCSVPMCL